MNEIYVGCPHCQQTIGVYEGPLIPGQLIESRKYTANDGSHPQPNTPAVGKCEFCGEPINYLERILVAAGLRADRVPSRVK